MGKQASAGINNFSDLTITQQGKDTIVTYGGRSITLEETLATDIDASDFGAFANSGAGLQSSVILNVIAVV